MNVYNLKNIIKILIITFVITLLNLNCCFCDSSNYKNFDSKLIPSGEVVIISFDLKYPFISSNLSRKAKLKESDVITALYLDGVKQELNYKTIEDIMKKENVDIKVDYVRDGELNTKNMTSDELRLSVIDFEYGCLGTITAIDGKGNFVGLSHSIKIDSFPLVFNEGTIFETSYIQSNKNNLFKTGNITTRSVGNKLGTVKSMGDGGIYGTLDNHSFPKMPALNLNTPKEGIAYIYCKSPVSNEFKMHEIEIIEVSKNISKIKVIDDELLKYRGGIVRGMSGSPIIQDNKIVGGTRGVFKFNKDIGVITNIDYMLSDSY